MSEITHIADKTMDNRHWSIADMLEQTAKDIRDGNLDLNPNRALVLLVEDTEDDYHPGWRAANISSSQVITLCELGKAMALEDLGY